MKKIIAIVLMAAVMLCCTACGLDMSKVKGDWTIDTIGGKTISQLTEENGTLPIQYAMNMTVTDDSATLTNAATSVTYSIQVKSNGFECCNDAKEIIMSVTYDAAKDTLSYKVAGADGNPVDYVLKKGTADLTVPEEILGSSESAGYTAEAEGYSAEAYYTGEAE